jgi:hypothetical protein
MGEPDLLCVIESASHLDYRPHFCSQEDSISSAFIKSYADVMATTAVFGLPRLGSDFRDRLKKRDPANTFFSSPFSARRDMPGQPGSARSTCAA